MIVNGRRLEDCPRPVVASFGPVAIRAPTCGIRAPPNTAFGALERSGGGRPVLAVDEPEFVASYVLVQVVIKAD